MSRNYLVILLLMLHTTAIIAQSLPLSQKQELYDKKVVVLLPNNFKQMGAEEVAKRYDPTNPPNYVFSAPESSVNLVFTNSLQIAPTDEASMKELVANLKGSLEKSYPAMYWVGSGTLVQNGQPIGTLEFKSLSPNNALVYNIMYLISVKNQLVIANFNCECSSADAWVAIGKKILAGMMVKK